jgi:hypothetical protein
MFISNAHKEFINKQISQLQATNEILDLRVRSLMENVETLSAQVAGLHLEKINREQDPKKKSGWTKEKRAAHSVRVRPQWTEESRAKQSALMRAKWAARKEAAK